MTSRERLKAIISGEGADRVGLWIGAPHRETWTRFQEYFGTDSNLEIRKRLGDDFVWVGGGGVYQHPQGKRLFAIEGKNRHGFAGPFAHCESVDDIDAVDFEWPDIKHVDVASTIERMKRVDDQYRASGLWTQFYHIIMNLFGMENYLVKMYTNPDVVRAVTDKVCTFYYEANRMFFEQADDNFEGFFFGNDFGTQRDMICGPDQFDEFIMPWLRRFTDLAHDFDKQVILHSCGSIYKVIDRLIDARVDCLHPLQAEAANMNADTLAREFKGRIAFMGGVDTQKLLVNGTPRKVKEDVRRIKELLGPNLIISPSHEAVLPDIPPQNIEAMAEAALE